MLTWDFNCPNTLAQSFRRLAVPGSEKVEEAAEALKVDQYRFLESKQHIFAPIAIETLV